MKIEVLFHDITYNNYINDDIFNAKAYIINKDTLNKRIINPKTQIVGELIEGYYLKYEKNGIIRIESDKIKTDDEYYAYIIIEKDINNKNIYKTIKVQYSVNEIESGMEIYPNKYYFSSLAKNNSQDYYLITKQSAQDNYLIIDIAENIPVKNSFDFQTKFYPESKSNINDVPIQKFDFHGRKRLLANLTGLEYEGLKLYVVKNSSDDNYKNYSINYYSLSNIDSFENYTNFNDSLIITGNNKKSNLIFNNIWRYKRFFSINNITYYIDIFEKKGEISNEKSIFSTYIGNHDDKINKKIIINDVFAFDQNVSVEIDIPKEDFKNKNYIRVLADMDNSDGTRDKFLYNSTLIDNDQQKKVDVNENLVFYVILYMVIVCVIIMIIVAIFIKLHKRKEEPAESDLNTSNMPLNDKERTSEI